MTHYDRSVPLDQTRRDAPSSSPGPPPPRPSRLSLLDLLRFLAAFSVLLYHFTARASPAWSEGVTTVFPNVHQFTKYGYLGVELFFFVSGFVILMTAWGRDVPGYVASRVARLFPAYWVGVVLTGLLLVLLPAPWKDVSPREILMNLTMLQVPFGVRNVDGVYWTLWVELRFYALIALFMVVGISRARVLAFAMAWPVVAAIAARTQSGFLELLLISEWAPFFSAGMLLYVVHREGWSLLLAGMCAAQVIFAMTTAGDASAEIVKYAAEVDPTIVSLVVVVSFLAVAAVTTTRLRLVSWRAAVWFGALTYPLYLVHEYWGWWAISVLRSRVPDRLALVMAVLFVLSLAWLIHRLVERPLSGPLRRAVRAGLASGRATTEKSATETSATGRPTPGAVAVGSREDVLATATSE